MENQELFEKVWSHLLKILQTEVDKSNESRVAKRLDVSPSTVTRWLKGERGERVELNHCLRIVKTLGGNIVGLMKELGFDEIVNILEMDEDSRTFVNDVVAILERGGPAAEKLKTEIKFLRWLALGPG